jgi:hypothetical protein
LRAEPNREALVQPGCRDVRAQRLFMSNGGNFGVDDLFVVVGDQDTGDVSDMSLAGEAQPERAAGGGNRLGGQSVGQSGVS